MPTLDTNIKDELIECINSFFIPYKANFKKISQVLDILQGANAQLDSYKKDLDKTKATVKMFPEILPPEEGKKLWREGMTKQEKETALILEKELGKKSEFGRILDDLHSFLDGVIMLSLTSYELQVTKQLKEVIIVLNDIIEKIIKEIKQKYFVLPFTKSDLAGLKEFLSYISEQISEFDKDSEDIITAIINIKKHRPIGSGRRFKPVTPMALLTDYNNFLKENKPRIARLTNTITILADQIKLLEKQAGKLLEALEKSY